MTSTLIKSGQISLIIGPMFSGKSTELLRYLNVYCRCFKTVFVTNTIDTRAYLSHNPIINTNLKNTTIDYKQCSDLNIEELAKYDVVGIDEAQFFKNLKEPVLELAKLNKIIFIAGLDADSEQKMFTEITDLIPYAIDVKKQTALCNKCIEEQNGTVNVAPATIRKTQDKERLIVGQEDTYSVVCLKHLKC